MVTNPAFRQLGSDAIIITRDLFADAASSAAQQAGKAAEKARPSEEERQKGVDFDKLGQKGKKTAKGLASGRIQGEAKESLWDELENGRQWVDENVPAADEAKDKVISRLQQVGSRTRRFKLSLIPLYRSLLRLNRTQNTDDQSLPSSTSSRSTLPKLKMLLMRPRPNPTSLTKMRRSNKPAVIFELLLRRSPISHLTMSFKLPRK
jgi:hypothetical protein